MTMIRYGVTEGPNKHVHIGLYAIYVPAKSKQVLAMYVPSLKVLSMHNTKYSNLEIRITGNQSQSNIT